MAADSASEIVRSAAAARVRMYAKAARYRARSTGIAASWPAIRRTVSVSSGSRPGPGPPPGRNRWKPMAGVWRVSRDRPSLAEGHEFRTDEALDADRVRHQPELREEVDRVDPALLVDGPEIAAPVRGRPRRDRRGEDGFLDLACRIVLAELRHGLDRRVEPERWLRRDLRHRAQRGADEGTHRGLLHRECCRAGDEPRS